MKRPHEMTESEVQAELAELDGQYFALLHDYQENRDSDAPRDTAGTVEVIVQRRIVLLVQLEYLRQVPFCEAS